MDDEVDVVHQDPVTLAASLHGVRIGAEVALQADLNLIGDGYILAIAKTGADKKVIREAALGFLSAPVLAIARM